MSAMMRVVSIVDTATSVDMTEGCQYKSHDLKNKQSKWYFRMQVKSNFN